MGAEMSAISFRLSGDAIADLVERERVRRRSFGPVNINFQYYEIDGKAELTCTVSKKCKVEASSRHAREASSIA